MTGRDPMDYGWWLASRASGIVALALISLSVGLGLAMAGRVAANPRLKRPMLAIHEHTALASLIAIAVHGITLLGDRWLHPGPTGIAVPFAMDYRPLATGLGITAGYLAAALGLSFYARRRIGTKRWRSAHRLTTVAYVLSVIHAATAGSDVSTPWMRALLVLAAAPVLFLLVMRVLPAPRRPRATASAGP
jgi:methionine sulfoxide reductase heme-binding subunit